MVEIRLLRESDDRSRFRSGDANLDRFLEKYAGQNQFRHHLGTTYVAVETNTIVGYVTVAPGQIEFDDIPSHLRRQLPRYPLPVLRVARLAVDGSTRGRGVGRQLLRFALELASRLAHDFGCVGVMVDAKPDAVAFYERLGFTPLDVLEGQSEARPAPTALFLPIREIVAASKRR